MLGPNSAATKWPGFTCFARGWRAIQSINFLPAVAGSGLPRAAYSPTGTRAINTSPNHRPEADQGFQLNPVLTVPQRGVASCARMCLGCHWKQKLQCRFLRRRAAPGSAAGCGLPQCTHKAGSGTQVQCAPLSALLALAWACAASRAAHPAFQAWLGTHPAHTGTS